ncbi:putativeinactive leucine-rich repeat receptor-like protein kinase [Quercus suber]|uniref:Putativeinactive leucine-rich repeat receptor-like protein kinase n=1 Tax=Quercus suber TaxID=58331 RepID=A0AAW0M5G4_QUESU
MGIENCKYLQALELSFNKLSGAIPSNISTRLPYVIVLDLSRNNFSSEIPTNIANCVYLNSLKLDHNRLTGQIPQQLGQLTRIKTFTVANNFLSGLVPNFAIASVSKESYVNNSGLCGGPLEPCKELGRKLDETFKSGFIVGYAVSVVSIVTIFMSYCVPWEQMKKRKMMTLKKNNKRKEAHKVTKLLPLNLQWKNYKQISTLERWVTRMTFADFNKATKFNSDNIIGLGKMRTADKATLPNGLFLAVKRLYDSQ